MAQPSDLLARCRDRWNLGAHDAVVLLARKPPAVEYFSFTTFALFMPRRGRPMLPFASLGDSVNSANLQHADDGLFAHVVTANQRTRVDRLCSNFDQALARARA